MSLPLERWEKEGPIEPVDIVGADTNRLLGHLKHLLSAGQVRLHTGIALPMMS